LALRVVTSALLGSFLVLLVAGFFLLYRVNQGIVTNARESAILDANDALAEIDVQMSSFGSDYANSDAINAVVTSAIQRGNSSGRYQAMFVIAGSAFWTTNLDTGCIPKEILDAVEANPVMIYSVPVEVRFKNGYQGPGLVVASGGGTDRDRYQVYFVFSFEREAETLSLVATAVGLSWAVVLAGITLVAYIVARQTLTPLRVARRAAEKLASGELTQLMPVRGTDDLAQLAVAMNHMAHQLQLRIREWEELSRLQQRFVADVSHELRTPLTTMRMAVDVLYEKRESLPEVQRKSMGLLDKELTRFEALLGDLLEISRFDAGAAVLVMEEVDLVQLVQTEMDALAELALSTGATIELHGDSECKAQIDRRRISRLITNLLSNAIEHGEGHPIDIFVRHDEEVVALAVRDHGVGFTPDQGRQVFNRFWRGDPARARHIGGTGLGLSISQEDVRLHQGWIDAWGSPGRGAQFRVVLPRRGDVHITDSPIPLVPADVEEQEEQS